MNISDVGVAQYRRVAEESHAQVRYAHVTLSSVDTAKPSQECCMRL
jgi:hypothetical protein